MKKATMLTYLEEQLEKHLGDYEVVARLGSQKPYHRSHCSFICRKQ